jgi:peptidoglycan/xylan/chitin deacetylase (PgdA/CDA1 family)
LVYHQIAESPAKGAAFRSLYVSPRAFARQMRLLGLMGYQGLAMSGLLPYLRGEKQGRVVGITFDDGYLNNLTNALPVLSRCGFSSTCYCVSQRLGQTNVWDEAQGIAQTSLMDAAQLRQWAAGGQEVGAHTRHHVNLAVSDDGLADKEIALSKEELSRLIEPGVEHFCYPYGEYEQRHVEMARKAAFETATTTRRGRVHSGADFLQLPRVPVLRSTTLPVFWLKVATAYEDRRAK